MNAKERQQLREINGLKFSNLQNITIKRAVDAKQEYRQALKKVAAQKDVYNQEYIDGQTAKIKKDYAAKMTGIYQELVQEIDQLQELVNKTQTGLDLSDPALSNALKLIELGGKDIASAETISAINQQFAFNQPALRALQAVYKSRGLLYDGGIDKMIYDIPGSFDQVRRAADATFKNQAAGINSFASKLAKIAKLEGYEFESNPDPDGFGEALRIGAGLPEE